MGVVEVIDTNALPSLNYPTLLYSTLPDTTDIIGRGWWW